MKKPWQFKAVGRGTLTIELFDQIGEDMWTGEGTTASSFREELEAAGPGITDIKLLINSGGGEVFSGLAIYNLLLAHPATVTAKVIGLAASISSVIPMAASRITMARTALWMIHNPSTVIGGDAGEMRKTADVLDRVRDSMVTAYQRHMTKSRSEIHNLMQQESWFDATQAKSAGLVAEIDPDESEDDSEQLAAALRSPIVAKFFHPPARVAQIAARCGPADDRERHRRSRLRTMELHEMQIADIRAQTLETHARQLCNMRAAEPSEDEQRRRTMARRCRELRSMRLADLAKVGAGSEEEGRRQIMAARTKEVAAMLAEYAPVTFKWPSFS